MGDRRWARGPTIEGVEECLLSIKEGTLLAWWSLGDTYSLRFEGPDKLEDYIEYYVDHGIDEGSNISGLGKYVNLLLDVPGIPEDAIVGFKNLVEEVQRQLAK